jgi:hypothetical protein
MNLNSELISLIFLCLIVNNEHLCSEDDEIKTKQKQFAIHSISNYDSNRNQFSNGENINNQILGSDGNF